MATSPTPVDALPAVPDRSDRATFSARATAMFDALKNVFVGQVNAIAANVNGNAVEAAASAGTATAKASEAATSATNAATSASTASTKAGEALASANSASTSATTATTKAGEASTSATNAANSAAAAAASVASISSGPVTSVNGKTGVVSLTASDVGANAVTLSGSRTLYVTQSTTLTITNYDSATTYSVSATGGTASISGDQITYTAGSVAGSYALDINASGSIRSLAMTVQAASVSAPTITAPSAGATGIGQAPTISTAAFTTIGISDTQLNSDWEVRTATNGGGTLISSSLADATNKTSWTVPGNLLSTATTYYARVRHRGTALGAGPWSEVSFTTAATFGGLIGTQGGQGFGIGVCPNGSILTARGLSAMTGTTDKTHANYGNYQHSNGSIVCYVPKFFYRIGHASSPRYATYGANAHDVVGIDTFANEAAANAAGYALHRAFVNAGVEVDGFFMDKYLASKDGTGSCKSVANAVPTSLTTSTSYTNSNGMTGCTGILADAVVLARARGAGWNCAAAYHYDAVALLSLAHGQASTSATYCAWYDAAGTTNFPKGCNSGALADTNDASVTYATAGDSGTSAKPKTRATANFAKTTHNGQECGIADLNGSMWQALIGLTMDGTIATDTTQNTTGTAYVLKRSADFGALTGGFGGENDAWGTTSSLATLFDVITGFEPWKSTTGWTYYGNGANAVFSNATSGTDYQLRCNGIPILAGCSASGTNQFGNDGCYKYGRANQVPLAAGYWSGAAAAGVFFRYWGDSRSGGGDLCGFRCAAY